MNDRQQMVCAIALFANGYSHESIAEALGVTNSKATKLVERGAEEQSEGKMGFMRTTRDEKGKPVLRRK